MPSPPHLPGILDLGGQELERLQPQEQALGQIHFGQGLRGIRIWIGRGELDGEANAISLGLRLQSNRTRSFRPLRTLLGTNPLPN